MAGYSAVKPTLAKLAKFRQIRHRQCCGKTLSKLPNLPLRAFLDISVTCDLYFSPRLVRDIQCKNFF